MKNDKSQSSIKNISEKFLEVIFQSLERLEVSERYMRNGYLEIIEYIKSMNLDISNLNFIKLENMKLMISEFDIMFKNVKSIINGDDFKKMGKSLKEIKEVMKNGIDFKGKITKPFHVSIDHVKKLRSIKLSPLFFIIESNLCELRGTLIENLTHILYSQANKNSKEKQLY